MLLPPSSPLGSIMNNIPAADHPFGFVGGALALDFTNTVGGTHRAPSHEHLMQYDDLVNFAQQAGAIPQTEARRLTQEAHRHPTRAKDVLNRAIALREAMWRAFEAKATEGVPAARDLLLMNREIASALGHSRLIRQGDVFVWGWTDELSLERPLWPIARSAADVMSSPDALSQLRECASDTCEWLFLDRSRNHTRRWCDMNDCGGRAKVRRFRAKARLGVGS
jgi:predicted RNA-binding Zn ribbon-like protein